jgi:putative two-component system response regulator
VIVLIVDDSEINLTVYRSILGHIPEVQAVTYESPIAALAWAKDHVPDVAIVDFHMPELDGITFIERFRSLPSTENALIVMVTADTEREVRHRALEAGTNDFLTKPLDRTEFMARMRNLLALAKSRHQLADRAEWLREEVANATSAVVAREIETIVRLTRAAEFRDDVTGMHVIRVGKMCESVARKLGMHEEDCKIMLLAAPMHDIGKVATPDGVLLKPGPLTPEEFEIMKQHTTAGYEILKDSDSPMLRCAAEIALTHHERYDGSGYPRGIVGDAIPLSGRLCSIVDVFDALTSERPYKHAWSVEEALAELDAKSGTQFDPELLRTFQQHIAEIVAIKTKFSDDAPDVSTLRGTLSESMS